jgi:PAS domain S-box-containing protein
MEAIAHMSGIRAVCSAVKATSQLDELHIQARSSCVSIVENGQLLGILTERDIVRLSAEQRDLGNLAIREVMTSNVVTLRAADFTDIFVAVNLLQQHHIRHLPVVDDFDRLVGLVTHESLQQTSRPVDLLRLRIVSEVMTAAVICAMPDVSMLEIARLMAQRRVSSVMIVEPQMSDGQTMLQIPVGIVTERDIVQFQALNLNLETCQVQTVMSTPIFAVNPSDSLWLVQKILEQRFIQRLAVTGNRGELLGIVTQTSLLQALNPLELYNLAEALEAKVLRLETDKLELLEHRTIDLAAQVEERTKKLTEKVAQEQLVSKISAQIRSSLNLTEILDTAVRELQSILGCDRVSIWKFQSDNRTLEVVADWQDWTKSTQSPTSGLRQRERSISNLGQRVYDPCFSPDAYRNGKIHVIPDIYTAEMSVCHRDLLVDLKIRSKILVPILAVLDGSVPWGMISAIESERPRDWESSEIALVQQIATQMAIAIQQAIAYERVQSLNAELKSRVEQRTAQLQERENQLQEFFDNANDLIQSVSLSDGKFEYVNRSWQAKLGYPTAEIDRLTIFDILHPDEHARFQHLIQQLQSGIFPSIDRLELKLLTKTNQEAIVEGSLNYRYVDGHAVAIRGIFQDISTAKREATIRKQAAIALSESQQFLQTLIETLPLAVFWKDRESRYLGCNYNFARNANLTYPEEIVGKTDYDLVWGEMEGKIYRADDRQVIESGVAKLGIIETQAHAEGTSIWLETNKMPLRNLNGDIIGILGTYQDITERKYTETKLHRISERLSLSLKSGAVGCWEWDIIRDLLIWDDRMYELYGAQPVLPDSEPGETYATWARTIHLDDRTQTEALLAQALLGEAEFDTEFRVIHPDNSVHFIKAYGLVQRDEQERPYSIIGINFDITATKRDEAIRLQNERIIRQQAERESVLRGITQRIRRSLDLKTIFGTAVQEIRQFMNTDRVGIFKFDPQLNFNEGEFVAESVGNEFEPILGVKIYDAHFGEQLTRMYDRDRINVLEDIHPTGLPDYEIQILAKKFQVRANLVIPLFDGSSLWGLLCIHHCQAYRSWQESEINFVKQIAEPIGIGIQQATLYEKVQLELDIRWRAEEEIAHQLRQQQTLGAIAQQIRNSLKVEEILATATVRVKELMMVDRVAIFRVSPDLRLRAVEEVVSPEYPSVLVRNWENERLSDEEFEFYLNGNTNIVVDFQQDPWSVHLQEYIENIQVKSKIVAPILLLSGNSETDPEIETWDEPHLWGLLSIHSCSSQRRWQDAEAKLLQQIADKLAIAIHQANLFAKLQQELTERAQAESRLLESNHQLAISNQELARATRLKDEFLASMSHELRTPLNAILGLSESLQDQVFGTINERQQKSIFTIEKSGKHLLALINDILDLSKIEANKFTLELTDVSIQLLCQNSVLFIKELAHKRQIRLKTQLPEPLKQLKIRVDDLRFRQVLINLLSNAVKFTPEGGDITLDVRVVARRGEIRLEIETDDDPSLIEPQSPAQPLWQIAFSIIDTGIGIAPENMDKLFQSFVQIDSSLSRQYAGTGLGLALVKRIVEMHGGNVSVQSEVDRGSCFTISIPCDPIPAIAVVSAEPLVYPLTTDSALGATLAVKSQTSILLVEDDEGNIETMTTYLQSRGYAIAVVESGHKAISRLEGCANEQAEIQQLPDIILMDIQMPGMDGFETTRHIRQLPDCATIPIVALTALAMPNDRQKCLDAGANEYMSKPFRLSQLVATIETLVKK